MKVGLIGCGRWGNEIRRVLTDLYVRTRVYDPAHPDTVDSVHRLAKWADKVVVAVPPQHQATAVNIALEWEKPFFCEKPFTLNPVDAAFLRFSARLVQVHGAVGYIARHADDYPTAGKFTAVRQTSTAGYHDVSALWDVGVHDVATFVDWFGRPDHVTASGDFDSYEIRLENNHGIADLSGSRRGGKVWEYLVEGDSWTPYASETEPLRREMEWWLEGGDNLDDAVTTVETLSRCDL